MTHLNQLEVADARNESKLKPPRQFSRLRHHPFRAFLASFYAHVERVTNRSTHWALIASKKHNPSLPNGNEWRARNTHMGKERHEFD